MMKAFYTLLFCFIVTWPHVSLVAQTQGLSLNGALEKALVNNYDVIISKASSDIATINNNWGRAGRYPSIGFDLSHNNTFLSSSSGNSSLSGRSSGGVDLRWLLFDGFRVNITKERLEQLEELSRGQSSVVIENTIEDVVLAYFNVLLQMEKLEVYRKVLVLSQDRYRYEESRRELGSSVTYNVLVAKTEYLDDQALAMNQELNVTIAIRNLNYLMGESPEARWTLETEFEFTDDGSLLNDLMQKMTSTNQLVRNQYIAIKIKEKDVRLARSEFYPSMSFSTGVDFTLNTNRISDSRTSSSSIAPFGGVALSLDLFNGGVRKQAVEVARINREIADVEMEDMVHALTNQLMNMYDQLQVRKALLAVANQSVETAELNLNISDEKYRTGVLSIFNFRDIQILYQNAAIRKLESVYQLMASKTALTRLTGGFIQND